MAGGASGYHDDEPGSGAITDINVTPLVDITLVLLIIFMVTARLIVARGIQVEKPKTVAGGEVKGKLELTIRPGPEWFINGERVTDKSVIVATTRKMYEQDNSLRPLITADERVPHGQVMEIIDAVKGVGVERFAITTEAKQVE